MREAWSEAELLRVGDVTELELAVRRDDGSLRSFTTMWVVRVGDGLYVRSAGGPDRPWYRHALASRQGRIRGGGIEADVEFTEADPAVQDAIDSAYHAKYDRWGSGPVGHVTGPSAHDVTVALVRQDERADSESSGAPSTHFSTHQHKEDS